VEFVRLNVESWSKSDRLHSRLQHLGVDPYNRDKLLDAFAEEAAAGKLTESNELIDYYNFGRLQDPIIENRILDLADQVFTNVLYNWASQPSTWENVHKAAGVSYETVVKMRALHEATNMAYPADHYLFARSIKRKVIMHVGPTNSGKTHNALRALAAAESGCYAGPLRLLAHEVWERLNLGQIVPKGVDAGPRPATVASSDVDTSLDVDVEKSSPLRKFGSPKHARVCNLVTGEEQKIVDPAAKLLSCTVEMVNTANLVDVAVIDEIQLIGDPERGHAFSRAFLGLAANELYLCGEEAAVPLIEQLCKDTGDDLVIHRHERLTPLVVADEALGNFSKIEKGDCIVTFSRADIFFLKRKVEELTGMRCAVAYGYLPPEVRSEQAALFNDPQSGYDVIIGSDAVGMGLNL
jgi:ATP-dependent RNA helicase SUPV3L1/SUV3